MANHVEIRPDRSRLRAALILAALVAIFLGRPILHGQWYLPGDLTQVTGARTLPRGMPVPIQNGTHTDPISQMDPWFHYDRQELHAGLLPTWNPYDGLGAPQLANYQSAVLSPYSVPFYVLPLRWAFIATAFLKLWTLGFFAYLFLRRCRLRDGAALVGGIIYCFGGYHLLWLDWQHVGAAICLPAGAWATLVALQAQTASVRRRGLAALSLAMGSAVLAGHPETLYFSSVALALTMLGALLAAPLTWRLRLVRAAQLAGAGLLGVGIGAAQLLPFQEYAAVSGEYATRSGSGIAGLYSSLSLPLLAFPDTVGNPAGSYHEKNYLFGNYNEINGDYVGLVAMGLALLGLVALFRKGHRRPLALTATVIAALGWSMVHSLAVATFMTHLPVLKVAANIRSLDVWLFGVAVLAAIGVDLALARTRTGWAGRRAAGGAAAGVLAVAAAGVALSLAGFEHLRHVQKAVPGNVASTPTALTMVHRHVEWVLGCTVVAVLAVAVLVLAPEFLRGRRGTPAVAALVGVLVLTQFGLTGGMLRNYNPSVPSSLALPLTPSYAAAIAFTGNETSIKDRTTFSFADTNLWWRTPQLNSYDALGVDWYDDLFTRVFNEVISQPRDEGTPQCMENLRLFGVRYIWSTLAHPLPPGFKGYGTTNVVGPDVVGLRLVRVFGPIRIFEVPDTTGRFTVAPTTLTAGSEAQALDQVSSCAFDPDSTAVLLSTGKGSTTRPPTTATTSPVRQTVTPVIDQPEHLRLQVGNGAGGELVLRQTWFPGWQATVDGHRVAIDRADVAFRGIALPPGAHTVDLVYRPASVRDGLALSAAALLGTGLLALPYGWVRRRRNAGVPDSFSISMA